MVLNCFVRECKQVQPESKTQTDGVPLRLSSSLTNDISIHTLRLKIIASTASRSSGEIQHNDCASLNCIMADVSLARTANIFRAQKVSFSAKLGQKN